MCTKSWAHTEWLLWKYKFIFCFSRNNLPGRWFLEPKGRILQKKKSSRWKLSVSKVGLGLGITFSQFASASGAVLGVHSKMPWNVASVCPAGGRENPPVAGRLSRVESGVMVTRQREGSGDPGLERKSETGCENSCLAWATLWRTLWRTLPVDGVSRDTQAVHT